MNYIVLDMEWNQGYPGQTVCIKDTRRALTGEIIQIGAIKLDDSFSTVDRFVRQVKPIFYPKLHHRVKQLTGITPDELKVAEPFTAVFPEFLTWCGNDFVFLIWGLDDIAVLKQNLDANGIDTKEDFEWFNLQTVYNRQVGSENKQTALQTACETLGIERDLQWHNALNDAEYTARICSKLNMEDGIAFCLEQKKNAPEKAKKKLRFYDFSSPEEALEFARENGNECPVCEKPLSLHGHYVRKYINQYAAVRLCESDGVFVEGISVSKMNENSENSRYKVLKLLSKVENLDEANRKITQKRRKRRRKQNENSSFGKNSDGAKGKNDDE